MGLYIRENIQFLFVFLLWLFTGMYLGNATIAVIGLSMILLASRGLYTELLVGFWLILILSDSKLPILEFAKTTKKVLMVLLLLIVFLRRGELLERRNEIFNLFLPFFLWSLVLTVFNPEILMSLQKIFSYAILYLIVPVVVRYMVEHDQRAFYRTMVFFMVAYLSLGYIWKYIDLNTVTLQGVRFMGFMGNPNGLGVVIFLMILLFDTMCRKDPDFIPRYLKVIIWGVLILNLMYSQSRSALFAVLIYMIFSNIRILRGFVGILAFIVLVSSYVYLMENLADIITTLGLEDIIRTENIEEGSGRLIAWQFIWPFIEENFLVGKGFYFTEYTFLENYHFLSRLGHLGNAHNSYLTFWLDTGLIGLLLFLGGFIILVLRTAKTYPIAVPVFYAIFFSSNFESWLTASLNPNTITVLMIFSIMLFAKEDPNVLPDPALKYAA